MNLPTPCVELPSEYLANAKIVPRRDFLLNFVPQNANVVEVGVALGGFTAKILEICRPKKFYALDIYNLHTLPELWGQPPAKVFKGMTHREFYTKAFAGPISDGVVEIMENDSVVSLNKLADKSIDMIYVDAHHTYAAVSKELSVIRNKIKDTGIIMMNDYTFLENVGSKAEYGVIQATHEFMLSERWEMRYLALERYMFCDVLLTKIQPDGSPVPLPGT